MSFPSFANFGEWAERVLKVGGLLAVFGYVSLRAHLNFLGISNPSGLPVERYLMETWLWTVTTLTAVPFAAFLTLCLVLLDRWWRRDGKGTNHQAWWRGERAALGFFIALLAGVVAIRFWPRLGLGDLVVGALRLARFDFLEFLPTGEVKEPSGILLYYALCLVCAFGYAFLVATPVPSRAVHRARRRAVRHLSFVVLGVLALHIPLVFARSVHSMYYPRVVIFTEKAEEPETGLLILKSEEGITLWQANEHLDSEKRSLLVGETVVVPANRVVRIEVGGLEDIRKCARDAVVTFDNRFKDNAHTP